MNQVPGYLERYWSSVEKKGALGYDGVSIISGCTSDVQTRIESVTPKSMVLTPISSSHIKSFEHI